jgi:hypothetical protein
MARYAPHEKVFVHPLAYVRAERGWTYQDVVNVIARRVGNMAARREKAWRWEHRGAVPDRVSQLALAAELGVPPEHVDRSPWPRWLPAGDAMCTALPWSQTGSVEAVEQALERAVVDRRGFMILTGSTLVGVAEDWLHLEPEHVVSVVNGRRVSEEFLVSVKDSLPRLHMLHSTHGGDRARRLIDAELDMVVQVLSNSSYGASTATRLHGLAAELSFLAGWASLDAGLHAAAQRYWVAGLHAAHTAHDRVLGGDIIRSMSSQCHDLARPKEALRLARRAYEGAGRDAVPRMRAMLALRVAREHAALGDQVACEQLLSQAETAFAQASTTAEPAEGAAWGSAWGSFYDEAAFYAQVGTCYLDLKAADRAEHYFDKTLILMPSCTARDKAIIVVRRASAQLGLGDIDHACSLATEAVSLIQQAPSEYNLQRLMRVRARIPLPKHDPRARELDAQLAAVAV